MEKEFGPNPDGVIATAQVDGTHVGVHPGKRTEPIESYTSGKAASAGSSCCNIVVCVCVDDCIFFYIYSLFAVKIRFFLLFLGGAPFQWVDCSLLQGCASYDSRYGCYDCR